MKFTKEHEWVELSGDIATIGITDFAQKQLGDIVSIDLPKVGVKIQQGAEIGMVDSMKASSPIFSPISGEILEVNKSLEGAPETLNKDAQTNGWIAKIKINNKSELDTLLSEDDYRKISEAPK
jgi:glycine cleavage system H protein